MVQISLITNQHHCYVLVGIVFQLIEPLLYALESLLLGDVIDQKCSNSSSVIRTCDSTVSLLTSSVPDLSFDNFAITLYTLGSKLYTNGGLALKVELILSEP